MSLCLATGWTSSEVLVTASSPLENTQMAMLMHSLLAFFPSVSVPDKVLYNTSIHRKACGCFILFKVTLLDA